VVPRVDGTVLAASTREEGVFDARTTAEGVRYLIAMASGIFPELKDADFLGARAGVRPGWQDGLPIMGPVPGWEGISVASGHDSVGVMLSPGTAELMADYITTGDPEPLEPFGLSRFERDS
jgi:glycine oxidase